VNAKESTLPLRLAAAIDSSEEGLELFRRAARLAVSLNMALEATILEDQNLQHLADLAFGRTFGFSTGLTCHFDREALSEVARSKAKRIRKAHEELTRQFRISCTTVGESSVSAAGAILQLAAANRYVLARGLLHSTEIVRPRNSSRSRELNGNVLIVLSNDPISPESDVATGLRIARTLDRTPGSLAPTVLQDALTIPLQTRRGRASDKPIEAEFDERMAPDDLCAVAGRHKADLIVMPAELVGSSEDDFKTFLRRVDCPLLLINRAQPEDTAAAPI
jgi:hypothetical protein